MLPGGLHNPTRQGTLATPDSTYEWRRKGEHVTCYANMSTLLEFLMEDCCGGSPEICERLGAVLARSHCETVATA